MTGKSRKEHGTSNQFELVYWGYWETLSKYWRSSMTSSIQEILSVLGSCVRQGYEEARSMPPAFYTAPEFCEFEKSTLFREQWICLGRVDQIPERGDYFTVDLVGEPLIVVRGRDEQVRILANVCRHRGSLIAEGAGKARNFVCPYHAWSYDIDGHLIRAPLIPERPDFDLKSCRLPRFACEVWGGFIYVNLSNEAPPLAPQLEGLSDLLTHYHMDEMVELHGEESVWETNWKCLVENFMEGYHLSSVHQKTLHAITPTRLCRHFPPGEGYFGYFSNFPEDLPQRGAYHPDLTAEERQRSVMFAVPPGHVGSVTGHIVTYLYLQPATADTVKVKRGIAFLDQEIAQEERRAAADLFERTMTEDMHQLASLQKGLKAKSAQTAPLAPADYEGNVWDFYQYLATRLAMRA